MLAVLAANTYTNRHTHTHTLLRHPLEHPLATYLLRSSSSSLFIVVFCYYYGCSCIYCITVTHRRGAVD